MSSRVGLAGGRRMLRRRAVLIDVFVAAALTSGAIWAVTTLRFDRTVALSVVSAVACTTAVGWRRRAPVAAALVALTAVVVYQISSHDAQGAFISLSIVLTCYSVGRRPSTGSWADRRIVGVAGYGLLAFTIIEVDAGFSVGSDLLTWIPLAVLPIAAGRVVERNERMTGRLRELRSQLLDAQQLHQAQTIVEERTRVARELHDVVAHCLSVMVIQSGAARLLVRTDPRAARDALSMVTSSGREALTDLRRVVGVRRHGEDAFTEAAPGLAQLDRLTQRMRNAGLDIRLRVDGTPATLPAEVDLTAFRIIQEALTNVHKHAPSARTEVTVAYDCDGIELRVEDSGPAAFTSDNQGCGKGLVGMRERVALVDGRLHAGPAASGGFLVCARLPVTPGVSVAATAQIGPAVVATRPARLGLSRFSVVQVDALISVGWLAALETEAVTSAHRSGPLALNAVAVAVMALAGVFRRRAPFAFLAVVGLLVIVLSGGLASPTRVSLVATYALFVCSYTIAAYRRRNQAILGLAVMLAGVFVVTGLRGAPAGDAIGGALMTSAVWLVARVIRRHRALVADLKTATGRLAADRESRALLALGDERIRIARDLHAFVAGLVSAMVIQAQAAHEIIETDPDAAVHSIAVIEQTGRQALARMRQMLGVLRNPHSAAPLEPAAQPVAMTILAAAQS